MRANQISNAVAVIAIAAALAAPLAAGPFWLALLTQILIFGLLALSVDLLLGQAGLFSVCHASFFAVSAYTVAILDVRYGQPALIAAPAGLVAGSLLAIVYGAAVRTRGVYFILITIAMGYIIWGAVYRWASFTGGDNGITNVPALAVDDVSLQSPVAYYYFVLSVVIACAIGYGVSFGRHSASRCMASRAPRVACKASAIARPPISMRLSFSRVRSRASPACSTSTTTSS